MNPERLAHAKSVGFEPVDLTKSERLEELIEQILGVPEVDASIDAVGFEARGHGTHHTEEAPATVLNALMTITRPGGAIGIPGLYVTEDPGSADKAAQQGNLRMRFGLGWAKSHRLATGQTPVLRYNRKLMQAILHDRLPIAKIVNATVITLDRAPEGYQSSTRVLRRSSSSTHTVRSRPWHRTFGRPKALFCRPSTFSDVAGGRSRRRVLPFVSRSTPMKRRISRARSVTMSADGAAAHSG